jgi:NAD(P)H-dependent FMN reductase
MSLQIAILYGSVQEARQGIKAARFVDAQLCERGHATCLIDAKACRLPLLDRLHKEYPKGEAPEAWRSWRRSTAPWMPGRV